ncbi:hypothetical protein EH165_02915 [Nakamurella antarctica]|uniref:ATP-binding protein n=1 Tax=Nakamurella antarctica TaxID=1902245 RepID=A0A3G8ZT92_9ACTN|nr:hypothetical protein [Nakamurella antarctica]AZI57266.1 hypothetical protein EH165_02915 [Nakamurella antarctica]
MMRPSMVRATKIPDFAAVADPFGTAELRAAVVATWQRSVARLREDANAEESLAFVGYAGRVVVELAANAADAAIAAGVPGRIRFSVVDGELRVANTGAPLTSEGVAALASLRASAKRDALGTVGHFGVGFTAVLAVSEAPSVHSVGGGVQFSAARTAQCLSELGSAELDAEIDRRGGHVPILRLPWPAENVALPAGFTTEVRLPLLPDVDVAGLLAGVGDHLLLTLRGLDIIELPDRVLTKLEHNADEISILDGDVETRWRLSTRTGRLSPELLGRQLVEQRGHDRWWVTWATPVGKRLGDDVLYAPTPTDEPLALPARLMGSFPVDDTRRHLAAGDLADFLLAEAAEGYLQLMRSAEPEDRLDLLPAGGFGISQIDTGLRLAIASKARSTPLLVTVSGDAIRPEAAVMMPGAATQLLELVADAVPHLLPAPRSLSDTEAMRTLGVRTLTVAEMSSALGSLGREPQFWGTLYELLDFASPDDLADLPVPTADGRTVLGAKSVLLPPPSGLPAGGALDAFADLAAAVPSLRVVHPDAIVSQGARHLLRRLGAQSADATQILAQPPVLAEIGQLRSELEDYDPEEDDDRYLTVAHSVLGVVLSGGRPEIGTLADLPLTSSDGQWWPISELLVPGSSFDELVDPDAGVPYVDASWIQTYGRETVVAAGALAEFRIVADAAAVGPDHNLPDEDLWWDEQEIHHGPIYFTAIADLDLVANEKWPQALRLLGQRRDLLDCLRGPHSYSRWWISHHAILDGRAPREWRLANAHDLAGLFDVFPLPLEPELATAVGVRASLQQLLMQEPQVLLDRFIDPERTVASALIPEITAGIVHALAGNPDIDPPEWMRTLSGKVIAAEEALVLDLPWLAQVLAPDEVVAGGSDPQEVARWLDLDLASVALDADALRPLARACVGESPATNAINSDAILRCWRELGGAVETDILTRVGVIEFLTVVVEGDSHALTWWVAGDEMWTDGSAAGWGKLLAHLLGKWELRSWATAVLGGDRVALSEFGFGSVTK